MKVYSRIKWILQNWKNLNILYCYSIMGCIRTIRTLKMCFLNLTFSINFCQTWFYNKKCWGITFTNKIDSTLYLQSSRNLYILETKGHVNFSVDNISIKYFQNVNPKFCIIICFYLNVLFMEWTLPQGNEFERIISLGSYKTYFTLILVQPPL